jgi:hypothetical protein
VGPGSRPDVPGVTVTKQSDTTGHKAHEVTSLKKNGAIRSNPTDPGSKPKSGADLKSNGGPVLKLSTVAASRTKEGSGSKVTTPSGLRKKKVVELAST